ncbi:DUF6233 domain-containing protein [Streptomyces acidicola]|uniref:DUF6233 domain-containing protein n=1 Tax=Streptomyces acidicola TaxID=2596892 RepID=UPI003808F644
MIHTQYGAILRSKTVRRHVGGCHMAGNHARGVARDQVLRALTEGVPACTHCRPDTELGVLD